MTTIKISDLNPPTTDDATIEAMAKVILGFHGGDGYLDDCRDLSDWILAAIRSGKIPLPEDVPQLAVLRARVAELEATATMPSLIDT